MRFPASPPLTARPCHRKPWETLMSASNGSAPEHRPTLPVPARQHTHGGRAFAAMLLLVTLGAVSWGAAVSAAEIDYAAARERMVEQQLASTWRGISDPAVLSAMATVPRHEFVPAELRPYAYDDRPLPIGYAQTISQPYVVAFMTEKLQPTAADRILEIGTGSGYQAAILSVLVNEVYSIEIVEPLARRAESDLLRLGYRNVKLRHGDGYKGWPEAAPFDAIIVTCAPDHVPKPLIDQLRDGGRMIIPVGERGSQMLFLLRKHGSALQREAVLPVRFVPMTGSADGRVGR